MQTPRGSVPVLEIGGSHVTAALVDTATWAVEEVERIPLDAKAPADIIVAEFVRAASLVLGSAPALGLALPGPFDYEAGVAWYQGVEKFDALHGLDLRARLSEELGRPGDRFHFVNDAEAFTVGEWTAGTTRGCVRPVGITLGTGVGSAFLRDGQAIRSGPDVPPNGELFRQEPSIEDRMSHRAIVGRYAEEVGGVREIADRARAGEAAASGVLDSAFSALAEALRPWLTHFEADGLVLGGAISGAFDLVRDVFLEALDLSLPVSVTADTERSALVGAAARTAAATR